MLHADWQNYDYCLMVVNCVRGTHSFILKIFNYFFILTKQVRVPTHEDGTCLFWEFATDSYDIGFGVFFEWTKEGGNVVSVHISESEEEDDEDEEDDGALLMLLKLSFFF